MLNIGALEGILILTVIIIVVRPEDLPSLVRKIGKVVGNLKRLYYTIIDEFASYDIGYEKKVPKQPNSMYNIKKEKKE